MLELSVPVSSKESMAKAYELGADSVFVCLKNFSLGTSSGTFSSLEITELAKQKPAGKKLYCAIDCFFHNPGIVELDYFLGSCDFGCVDAFIISDIGIIPTLKKHFPKVPLHLSSFANCLNSSSAEKFLQMGFTRIIPGHEANIEDIGRMAKVKGLEIELQFYGTMCMSYSGRTLLSTHFDNCKVPQRELAIEEEQRPGTFFPIKERNGFITILSSKELNLSGELLKLISLGVNAFRIENPKSDCGYLQKTVSLYKRVVDIGVGEFEKNSSTCLGFLYSDNPIES